MGQLEQLILALIVRASVADSRDGKLSCAWGVCFERRRTRGGANHIRHVEIYGSMKHDNYRPHQKKERDMRMGGDICLYTYLSHLRVLDPIILRGALPQCTSVHADDGRVSEVRVHASEARCVRDGDVHLIAPRHGLANLHLLFLRGVHVSLGTND